jgi:hypothetical protein
MKTDSSVWGIVALLVVVAVLAYAIAKARRTREAHRARSSERTAAMLLAMHQEVARARPASDASRGAPASPGAATAPKAPPVRHGLQRRARLLDEHQRLLYLVLRAALTDHVIMANIRIADLIDLDATPNYAERDTRLRLLQQERIDCLVCTNELVPVAAIMIHDRNGGMPEERIKADALRELGLRFLRFRSDELPRPAEMRALILR